MNGSEGRKTEKIRFRMGVQFRTPFWNHFRQDFRRKPSIVPGASTLLNLIKIGVSAFTALLSKEDYQIVFGSSFDAKLAPILA